MLKSLKHPQKRRVTPPPDDSDLKSIAWRSGQGFPWVKDGHVMPVPCIIMGLVGKVAPWFKRKLVSWKYPKCILNHDWGRKRVMRVYLKNFWMNTGPRILPSEVYYMVTYYGYVKLLRFARFCNRFFWNCQTLWHTRGSDVNGTNYLHRREATVPIFARSLEQLESSNLLSWKIWKVVQGLLSTIKTSTKNFSNTFQP